LPFYAHQHVPLVLSIAHPRKIASVRLALCVPTLNRYDCLRDLLESAIGSSRYPDEVVVIDNGHDTARRQRALASVRCPVRVHVPTPALGVAASWNWFVAQVEEERVIVNDDVILGPWSLEALVNTPGPVVTALAANAFSCFVLRDACVRAIGLFDETLSPDYAYFEDCDYEARLALAGLAVTTVDCGVAHVGSSTVAAFSAAQRADHHRKFVIARENYRAKWGRLPAGVED
jgi:GT2 family glycosyltransferase